MKAILFASALLIGSSAFAQADPRDAGQPIGSGATLQPGTTMGERDTHGGQAPATTTMTPPATDTTTMPAPDTTTGTTMSTDTTTMGTTGSGTVAVVQQGGNMTAPPETRASYPRCSRTITDNCVQDESRASDTKGGRPARRRR